MPAILRRSNSETSEANLLITCLNILRVKCIKMLDNGPKASDNCQARADQSLCLRPSNLGQFPQLSDTALQSYNTIAKFLQPVLFVRAIHALSIEFFSSTHEGSCDRKYTNAPSIVGH